MATDAINGRSRRASSRGSPALGVLLLIGVLAGCSTGVPVTPPGSPAPASLPSGGPIPGAAGSILPLQSSEPPSLPGGTSPLPSQAPGPDASGGPATQDPAAPPPAADAGSLDAGTRAALQAILERARQRFNVPALSVAVLLADGRSWLGVSGQRRRSPATAADSRTVFAIASITKTFVTAVIMQLVAQGRLRLDDHLDRWLPTFPHASRITIRELLSHTSGVYNYFENPRYPNLVFSRRSHRWTFREILALVRGPYCAPGTCFHYSNTNFVLLGRVAQLVTGRSMAGLIRRRLIDPLGLQHTFFQPDEKTPADAAHGYLANTDWTRGSAVLPMMSAATVASSAGAMVSTAGDLARWASQLYTGHVVPQPLLDQMLTVRACHDGYGLGTRQAIINGRVADGHRGSLRGYEDAMWYFPRERATLVLLSNQGAWSADATVRRLSTTLFDRIGAPAPQYDPKRNSRSHDGVTLYC
jgi:D-alanyl-D-alanine carboxypeptidase